MYLKAYNEYWNAIVTECDLALEAVGKSQSGGETLDIQEIAAAIYSMKRSLQDKIRETSSVRNSTNGILAA